MLRIVSADSGVAELDENFCVKNIITTAAIYLTYPYRCATDYLFTTEPFNPESSEYIIRELNLAGKLAQKYKPDQIHIDISLGGIKLNELTKEFIEKARISLKGKQYLLEVLDEIKEIGDAIQEETGSEILFIGKESWAVRIAELTCAACAVKYAIQRALQGGEIFLGLPRHCTVEIRERFIIARSLYNDEEDLYGYIECDIPKGIYVEEFPNPLAVGFRILKIQRINR